jgi:xanthine dehydrogenase accessory factor
VTIFHSKDIYKSIMELRERGGLAVLVTVIRCKGSTPRKQGAKMLVYEDGSIAGTVGGGIREADVIEMACELLKTEEEVKLVTVDFNEGLASETGPVCGGDMELFMEKIHGQRSLIIAGAGHIGLCLYNMAQLLEYNVVIIDPRSNLNSEARFPEANRFVREAGDGLAGLHPGPNDAVVLVGPSHDFDQELLPDVLRSNAGYIGMIGSKRKRAEVYKYMRDEFKFVEDDLKRIHCPVGLEIGSESPAEIAVAIMAEIIKHFKQ